MADSASFYFILLLACLLAGICLGTSTASIQTEPLEDVGTSFRAYEEIPPTVTIPATAKRIFISRYPKNVKIDCQADGNPKPIISWYRDGEKIVDNRDIQVLATGALLLKDFDTKYNGYYQCRAENRFGLSLSQIQHIQYDIQLMGNNEAENNNVTEYEPFSIACDDLPPVPRVMLIRWYDKGFNNREIKVTERIGTDVTGTLHFAYTLMEDKKEYSCGVVASARSSIINLFPQSNLEVNIRRDEDGGFHAKPTVAFSTSNVKAVIGNEAVLQCFFSAKPVATITWKNSSNHVIENGGDPRFKVEDFGRRLVIDKVRQLDEGNFVCTGTNQYGSVESVIAFNVTAPPRPVPNGVLTSKTVPDKGSIRLPCKLIAATGENLDTPMWFRNGVPLNQSNVPSPRYKFSPDFQELHIKDLNKQDDTANFQCNTSNSEGSEFYDAYLRVINSIIITKKPASVSEIEYGDVIDISIEAKGDHCCQINKMWKLNGTDLNEDTFQPFQKIPGSHEGLLFNTSRVTEDKILDMYGTYTCRVSNQYQSIPVIIFNILPKASKTAPKTEVTTTKSGGIEIWWIALIAGLALIIIAIIVVVVIYRSKYPGSTYKLEEQEIKHNLNPEEDLLNQSFHEI